MAVEAPGGAQTDQQYYDRLAQLNVAAYWKMELAAQVRAPVPFVWRWKDVYPALAASVDLVELQRGGAERRVITMANPGRQPGTGATHTLQCSLQMILPGEVAPAHRHSFAAFRFIIQGKGAYTVVDGEKCAMEAGDMILTPSWTWHDHGSDGDQPMVWLDGLDVPLVGALRAMFYEDFPGRASQPVTSSGGSDVIFRWAEALERLRAAERDEHEGQIVEYLSPAGGHVMPTLACYLQALPAGFHTKRHRHSPSSVYFVVRGSGRSIVGDHELAWEEHDIVAVPNWTWHEHIAGGAEAILFSFSDRPALEALRLFREEAA
jgi:gentisate 1,2-dioxygenase